MSRPTLSVIGLGYLGATHAICMADLKGFTRFADRSPQERVIAALNDWFESLALAVESHTGEILKFMGDGLLAIYPVDLIAFFVKFLLVGVVVGVVSSYKGLTTGGGAEGVGRAVNATVVITFFTLWALSVVFNTGYLSLFPEVTTQRG